MGVLSRWTPWTVACQAPLSMEFSRQEYWSGLPCPPPGDLPNPGIEPTSLELSLLQVHSLPLISGKPRFTSKSRLSALFFLKIRICTKAGLTFPRSLARGMGGGDYFPSHFREFSTKTAFFNQYFNEDMLACVHAC